MKDLQDNTYSLVKNEINEFGSLYNQHSRWGVYDKDGVAPTLTAAMGMGGGYTPCVLIIENDEKTNRNNLHR